MITMVPPTAQEVRYIVERARMDEREQYTALCGLPWNSEQVIDEIMQKTGVRFVARYHDKAFVIGGYDHVVNDVWQSWMVGTMFHWETQWRSITKVSRRVMDSLMEAGARRLQTCVLASRKKTCEWYVKGLKMQLEGELRGFGANGETMAMFARVKE